MRVLVLLALLIGFAAPACAADDVATAQSVIRSQEQAFSRDDPAAAYSYAAPESYVDTNVKGTLNLLTAAKELGVKKFVHTSTSEVYGTAQYVPIDEKHPLNAQSPYAATKVGADQIAISFQRSFALPVAVIRPFNTFGPRQSARASVSARSSDRSICRRSSASPGQS